MSPCMRLFLLSFLLCAPYALAQNVTTPTPTSTTPTPTPSSTKFTSIFQNPASAWNFIVSNSWLATPVVAAIGWFNTWVIGAVMARKKGHKSSRIADLRYTGLIKRTCAPAFLADEYNGHPRQVIGYVTMDPGLFTTLPDLQTCRAGWFDFTSWAVQVGAMFYAIFLALYVWSQDDVVKRFTPFVQFPLLLGVLNINRGTWAIAVCGCFYPGTDKQRMQWLMGTTILALSIDWVMISRALEMAWHINQTFPPRALGLLAWILPTIEAFIFFAGLWTGYAKIEHVGPWFLPFVPAALWLTLGPLFVILVSVLLHYNQTFLNT